MAKYHPKDVARLKKFVEDLTACKPKDNYLVSITKLANLLNKTGFVGPIYKAGSKRQFSHDLLKTYARCFAGTFLMTEAHGKKGMMHYRNYQDFCRGPIEYVIDRIEREGLIVNEPTTEEEQDHV